MTRDKVSVTATWWGRDRHPPSAGWLTPHNHVRMYKKRKIKHLIYLWQKKWGHRSDRFTYRRWRKSPPNRSADVKNIDQIKRRKLAPYTRIKIEFLHLVVDFHLFTKKRRKGHRERREKRTSVFIIRTHTFRPFFPLKMKRRRRKSNWAR